MHVHHRLNSISVPSCHLQPFRSQICIRLSHCDRLHYTGSSSLAPRLTGNVILPCLLKMWIDIAFEAGVSIFYKNRFFIQYRTEMYLNTNVVLLLLDKLLTKKILYVPNVFMIHCKEKRFCWKCNFLLQLCQWMYVVCTFLSAKWCVVQSLLDGIGYLTLFRFKSKEHLRNYYLLFDFPSGTVSFM